MHEQENYVLGLGGKLRRFGRERPSGRRCIALEEIARCKGPESQPGLLQKLSP
jgi:hypothetical protein